jgi:hypothetical protein
MMSRHLAGSEADREYEREAYRETDAAWAEPELPPVLDSTPSEGLFSFQAEPPRRNYRLYLGLGLAALLALLIYVRWRGDTFLGNSGAATSELPPEAPVAAKSDSTRATTPAVPSKQPAAAAHANNNPATTNTAAPPTATIRQAAKTLKSATPKSAPTSPVANSAPAGVFQANGSDDLANAEKYLNGGAGRERDTTQAATWLWRAVAKQNLTASLLLSDLYLRGDGVTKSCDQARLLLDAAARKGAAPAAERLRHLPEFGCQ